jgi:multidrug efflux pump subunit AcrA (membrane-fusion protein)
MKKIPFSILLALGFLLAACGAKTEPPTVTDPIPTKASVIAEGHLSPVRGLYLFFPVRGRVAEILVAAGDRVTAGQVLVRLGDGQQAEAVLAASQLELTLARQEFDTLVRTADLAHAHAWQAYMDAQKIRLAAQLAWDRLDLNDIQVDIDNARADVTSRQTDLEDAQKDLEKYSDLPAENATRRSYEDSLRTAQIDYDTALQKLEQVTNRRDSLRTALDSALAFEAEALRLFENTQDGPDPDKLALSQGRLDAAQARLAAAQAALDSYSLKAPFSATVVNVDLSVGEWAGPESYAVAIADYSAWVVETSDLSELDVVDILVGQAVQVTADALPELVMTGVVESISGAPRLQGGDILYTVRILMDEVDPALLWGMTVEAKFDLEGK